MKRLIIVTLLLLGFAFVSSGRIYSHQSPSVPSNEPEVSLEALGTQICFLDNYGFKYTLTVGNGQISGTADVGTCGFYSNVQGTYTGTSFSFHVGGITTNIGCVEYTYTGVVNRRSRTASGTWVNDPGSTGTFTGSYNPGSCP